MGYWARTLVLLLWRVRRRLAPDGSPLEKLLRLPRRAVRLVLGDSKAKKPAASKPLAAATARPAVEGPTVSLLVPLGPATDPATPEALLTETINAVLAQSYPNWELWLCDVGGGAGPAWEAAQRSAASDLRVRTVSLPGGISTAEALNQALKSAVGEMVGLLSPGDLLSPNALDAMLEARTEHAGADVLYSDEDSVDARGIHGAPLSKFNWSPELALAYPYTGRLCLMQRTLVLDLGGYRPETLAAEEYDLILRAATRGVRIEHVRQVLYSRRRRRDGEPDIFGTIAAVEARRAALEEHLARRRIPAEIVQVEGPERLRVRPTIQGRPLVSIIIPTRDKLSLLRQCISSIEAKTRDLPYEIVIVDNNSVEPDTLAYFASFGATSGHTIVPYPGPFNFAGEINAGARAANGEYLVLLNNDTEIISPDWLTALLEWSQLPGIGCVGARLLFDNGAFQHVGIALYQGSAHHPFYLKQTGQENRWTDTDLVRNCAGATAACLMVHRDRFEQLGGFDESFPINYNDIDFCIRLAEQGYRNLYTPYAVLYHHESSSRPPGVTEAEHARLRERHGPLLWNDPYWGPSARPATPEVAKQAKGPAPAPAPLLTAAKNLVRTRIDRERTMLRQALDVTRYEGEGESFYGLPVSADIPTEIGSSNAIRWQELVDVAGDPKLTLFMHPPYSRGFIVKLPEQAAVRVSSALVPEVWGLNKGGVEFTVSVGPLGGSPFVTQSWIVNPGQIHEDRTWRTVTLDLAAYAGQTVEVRFGTAVAPGAPSAYAWAIWGDPRLLVRRPTRAVVLNELHEGVYRLRTRGPRGPLKRYRTLAAQASSATRARKPFAGYAIWLRGHLRDEAALEQTRLESERFSYRPTISLITPVYNTDPHWLELLVASIKGQTYPNWELCLCDDGSTNQATIDYLAKLANDDPRIKTSRLPQNGGISAASNGALALATGEFIGLLDHDDELTLDALYEVARVLQTHPDADLIYSDEDKLEPDGSPSEPFFKPDWSPDYLNSTMYVGHLGVYRRSIVDMVGGFRTEFDGSQDYDLALRVSEHAKRVCHIPRILYRWRKIATSTAGTGEAKPWALDASFRALADHATRLSPPARAENRPGSGYARVKYQIVGNPLVSIVIPTDGRIADTAAGPRDLLLNCVRSVVERTAYKNYELVIVDNGHVSAAAETYLATVPHRRLTYHETVPFNFANKVNFAINGAPGEHARGEHILLLNDDIEVISEEWLSAMLEFSQQPDVGVVGAKLYFPDGRLQHIGVIVGIGGGAVHIFSGFPKDHPGHFGAAKLIRDFSAVTGACMMTSRAAFERVGGFNETFLTDFNDVDYCLRLRELGYRIVYQPFAELTHYEGATFGSRERIVNPAEVQAFSDNWGHVIANDPYFNPNLSRATQTYDVRM